MSPERNGKANKNSKKTIKVSTEIWDTIGEKRATENCRSWKRIERNRRVKKDSTRTKVDFQERI